MNNPRLQYLFQQYFEKKASAEERTELANLLEDDNNREHIMNLFTVKWATYPGDGEVISEDASNEMLKQILEKTIVENEVISIEKNRKFNWRQIAAAAAIISFIAVGYWLFTNNKKSIEAPVIAKNINEDVNPGSFKARLTLADGSTITLDSAALGELTKQGGTVILNKDGKLVYNPSTNTGEVLYNTVATANGETYSLTLADGSQVWLNAGSSIRFPVAFSGKERRIETTGEVYVKVAKNPAQPFVAVVAGMEVLALGTEFNINAYSDETNGTATLIEGSVKVSNGTASTILQPGQQTNVSGKDQLTVAKKVNLDEITSWKEGKFHFESADLKTILRQFARWYDVEVQYAGAIPTDKYFVIINRNVTLASVLKALQANGINFKIEGKKLLVQAG